MLKVVQRTTLNVATVERLQTQHRLLHVVVVVVVVVVLVHMLEGKYIVFVIDVVVVTY